MATYKNIEEYRRKKKVKSFVRKTLILVALFAILFVLLYVLQIFKGSKLDEIITGTNDTENEAFPLTIKNEQLLDIGNFGNRIAVLAKSNVLTYSMNGKKESTIMHGYTNPVMKEGNKRLLTYDRGGYKFRVDTHSGKVGEIALKNTIICAEIGTDGSVAVVTEQDQYASYNLLVYDSSLKERYKFAAASDSNVTATFSTISFSSDNNHLAACAVTADSGILSTYLYELDLTRQVDATVTLIPDLLPLDVSYKSDGNIAVVGKDSMVFVNSKTHKQVRDEHTGDLENFVSRTIDDTVVVNKNLFNSTATVSIFSSSGVKKATCDIDDEVIDSYCDGSRVLILGKKAAYNFDMNLLQLNKIDLSKSFSRVIYNGEYMFVMGADTVEKYAID